MHEYFNLKIAHFTVHVMSMIFSVTEYVYGYILICLYTHITLFSWRLISNQCNRLPCPNLDHKEQTHMSTFCAHNIGSLDITTGLPPLIYRPTCAVNLLWSCDLMATIVCSSLLQAMACRQFAAKSVTQSLLHIFNWTTRNKFLWHFKQNTNIFDAKWVNTG